MGKNRRGEKEEKEGLLRKTKTGEKRGKKREFWVRVLAGVWEGEKTRWETPCRRAIQVFFLLAEDLIVFITFYYAF